MSEQLRQAALDFHEFPIPGKIEVTPTKSLATQRDLALAYSPGVAEPCLEIEKDPLASYKYTARGNLVAVISNGTAVLGLGNIGALAGKPVMEGKGVLFKKFAGINVFDIEVNEHDPDKLVDIIASLEPTFGGVNLEDIKAPECFYIEQKLRERMNIPVFHDDQHGTAIISAAAIINSLRIIDKKIEEVRLVASGAGAASIACLNLLLSLGMKRENITICDSKGVVYKNRGDRMDKTKEDYAIKDNGWRTLADAIPNADIFLGCSAAGALTQDMVKTMAAHPIILALANPNPEITPPEAKAVRPDAIVCTGRSDYPNQVNNVLCFPFIFRGALDVGATTINEEMKRAAVYAIADLALEEQNDVVTSAYGGEGATFGPEYVIPRPFDPRLIVRIAPAVAKAAMESGVATRPIENWGEYTEKLTQFVYKTSLFMRPIFSQAKSAKQRIILAEGEEAKALHAVQEVISMDLASPILIGRKEVIEEKIKKLGLRLEVGVNVEVVDNENNPRYEECWKYYYNLTKRKGITPAIAKRVVRSNTTVLASVLVNLGYADGLVCGLFGSYGKHLDSIKDIIGLKNGVKTAAALNSLVLPSGNVFLTDTHVNDDPSAEELAEITLMAADEVHRFGIEPAVALLSHSNFGSSNTLGAPKVRDALKIVQEHNPQLMIDGEMRGDIALCAAQRSEVMPDSPLKGSANLLVFPNLSAARISYSLLRGTTTAVTVGPILMGMNKSAHILNPSASVRRIINMIAYAAVQAQQG
ncbi:NADP-dependent malic enzyme [Rodentibacter pneumotropicus]|uniref:NADP-dependent malic enzyme n=2 Tax=Rodentibacter pneumotropicus TaxID=758 RepID=A0A4S2QKB5_9PAST|nr:NADP-dependent malic enzyme [Rodentibacter pneumotropicus]THA01050.1 NADP-dependent malic enzyme [Rodentibacter pneumotropicus]THA03112.1 NADP-dependent malic enzyme [Rodentibacter pneumotropicus]THA05914.1 NADP-dependent malic enzyme [Rodentibacter pneumotropicus]THA17758.1 NADP-dependent malic enzyme [Rodentibacter pneumotropicus]